MYSVEHKLNKIQEFCDIEGYADDLTAMMETMDSGLPNAICLRPDCDYTAYMEPDQDAGWCPECQENTVCSILVLGGVI